MRRISNTWAVVLAGGDGTRLRNIIFGAPRPDAAGAARAELWLDRFRNT